MSTINVPSYKEIYYFAYLAANGWEYDEYYGVWKKPGKLRKLSSYEEGEWKRWKSFDFNPELWTTEDAYWEQRNDSDKDKIDA